jgi:hypothetical protein
VAGLFRSHVSPKTLSRLQKETMRRREMAMPPWQRCCRLRCPFMIDHHRHDSLTSKLEWFVLTAGSRPGFCGPIGAIVCGGLGIQSVRSQRRFTVATSATYRGGAHWVVRLGIDRSDERGIAHSIAQPASTTNSRLAPA